MAEYIDREQVLNDIGELFTLCYETRPNDCGHHFIVEKELETHLDFVRNLPIVDIQPVVHGKWIDNKYGCLACSNCKTLLEMFVGSKNYCPNCGAKMDKED